MSVAEPIGRRALLATAGSSLLLSAAARAEVFTPVHHIGAVSASDGDYRSGAFRSFGDSQSWAFTGIRYGRAERFRAPVAITKAEQLRGDIFGPA